jgi:hypothetical protein
VVLVRGTIFAQIGSQPARWYLSAHFGASPGGGKFVRSDEDGASWTHALTFASGPAVAGAAYEPWNPDRVCAVLSNNVVRQSEDGGTTWIDLPRWADPGGQFAPDTWRPGPAGGNRPGHLATRAVTARRSRQEARDQ